MLETWLDLKEPDYEVRYDPVDVKIIGYLKSPLGPQIALLITEVHRNLGSRGGHRTFNRIVGSTLTTGFKKF